MAKGEVGFVAKVGPGREQLKLRACEEAGAITEGALSRTTHDEEGQSYELAADEVDAPSAFSHATPAPSRQSIKLPIQEIAWPNFFLRPKCRRAGPLVTDPDQPRALQQLLPSSTRTALLANGTKATAPGQGFAPADLAPDVPALPIRHQHLIAVGHTVAAATTPGSGRTIGTCRAPVNQIASWLLIADRFALIETICRQRVTAEIRAIRRKARRWRRDRHPDRPALLHTCAVDADQTALTVAVAEAATILGTGDTFCLLLVPGSRRLQPATLRAARIPREVLARRTHLSELTNVQNRKHGDPKRHYIPRANTPPTTINTRELGCSC